MTVPVASSDELYLVRNEGACIHLLALPVPHPIPMTLGSALCGAEPHAIPGFEVWTMVLLCTLGDLCPACIQALAAWSAAQGATEKEQLTA